MYTEDTWHLQKIEAIANLQICLFAVFMGILVYPN